MFYQAPSKKGTELKERCIKTLSPTHQKTVFYWHYQCQNPTKACNLGWGCKHVASPRQLYQWCSKEISQDN